MGNGRFYVISRSWLSRRLLSRFLLMLAMGLAAAILVAWICAAFVDVLQSNPSSVTSTVRKRWATVSVWQRPGAELVSIEWQNGPHWSPTQATGAPDSLTYGDMVTAWAPASTNGSPEWLSLEYPHTVIPKRIHVFETYNPGAVYRITAFNDNGTEKEIWRGTDPSRGSPTGSFITGIPATIFPVTADFPTQRIKLYQGTPEVLGWNEIDAVGIEGPTGEITWASDATASSWYGSASYAPLLARTVDPLPSWAEQFAQPPAATLPSSSARVIDGRGWPFIALTCDRAAAPNTASFGLTMYTVNPRSGLLSLSTSSSASGSALPFALPWRPVWFGLAIDALLFGTALGLLRLLLTAPLRFVVEVGRMRHGRCIRCGYNLQFDFAPGCPECGWRRDLAAREVR